MTAETGWRARLADLLSLRYALLRGWTAGSALLAGLIQTFVFARVLEPERFSLFILVGAVGISMWLFDLGLPKILFVEMRARHLSNGEKEDVAQHANGVLFLYLALAFAGALVCFVITAMRPGVSLWEAVEFGLFFLFCSLNLAWFVLRNLSIAVDEFISFETLDSFRRVGHIVLLLAMLAGLPISIFVIAVNVLWLLSFALAARMLFARGALTSHVRGVLARLAGFFRAHGAAAWRTGTHAASEIYFHNVMYLVVPTVLGLGAPTIVLDTTFKVFFGTLVLYSAACDLLVPRQTRAFSEHDRPTLRRATALAAALCMAPALVICCILYFGADRLFSILLSRSATVPHEAVPILYALLAAGIVKTVSNFLLQHTGFFRDISRLALAVAAGSTIALFAGAAAGLGLLALLWIYAASYGCAAALYLALAIRGPLHGARAQT